ncbi:hypothetical protein MGWOODY_XGa2129 [hydrothermal vent metagenome]|uniref:Uncharacterized protein n=1 Tax=hydrothermal vent metagenome TaxID=652676 RepID=A0A160TW73_9ZZZZ
MLLSLISLAPPEVPLVNGKNIIPPYRRPWITIEIPGILITG